MPEGRLPVDDVKVIGERLKKLRGDKPLELVAGELYRLYQVRITRQTLNLYELGQIGEHGSRKLAALAAYYGTSVDYLLSGRDALQRRRVGRG